MADKVARADKVALITGVTGQDGAYLAELLLGKGYVVHGVKRRSSSFNTERVDDVYVDPHELGARFFLHYGDLTDATNLIRLVQLVGDASKARTRLGWSHTVGFKELVAEMIQADLARAAGGAWRGGHS